MFKLIFFTDCVYVAFGFTFVCALSQQNVFALSYDYFVRFRMLKTCGLRFRNTPFLGVLKIAHNQHARADFDEKYVKHAVPRNDVPFLGQETKFYTYIVSEIKSHFSKRYTTDTAEKVHVGSPHIYE